jgi:hypothetical protein
MTRDGSFHCELEKSKDKNENGNQVTTIKCHGELVSDTAGEIKELVRPFIPLGGRIISVLQFSEQFRAALKRSS